MSWTIRVSLYGAFTSRPAPSAGALAFGARCLGNQVAHGARADELLREYPSP